MDRPTTGPDVTIGDVSGAPYEMVFQETPVFVYEHAAHCHDCSRVEDPTDAVAPPDLPDPTFAVSVTLDGAVIATHAFRETCRELPGIVFHRLDGAEQLWLVDVDRVVDVEPFDSRIRSGPQCATCGLPRYVIRSGPLHLARNEVLPEGFSRTAIEFGDTADFGSEQPVCLRPNLLVDRDTGRLLKGAGLLGVHLIAQP